MDVALLFCKWFGEWFGSAAASKLFDSIYPSISNRYEIATGKKRKLQSVENNLEKMKAVIEAVESTVIAEDCNVASWLNDLKDVIDDAENVLDVFNYESIRRSVEASGNFWSNSAKRVKRAFSSNDSLHDLPDIVNKFDRLLNEGWIGTYLDITKLITDSNKNGESFKSQQTSPVPVEPVVFGRSSEMHRLLKLVLGSSDENRSNSEKFYVVSIVGIGGVGKTTLAQWLYNHEDVHKHFDLKAWVCVSDRFCMEKVMNWIIESASSSGSIDQKVCNLSNFGSIHEYLSRFLSGKRFLIVLDDVWEWDNMTIQWAKLISAFRNGKEGSRIVVSTRNQSVADKVSSMATVNLESLRDEEYWQFFKCCSFGGVDLKDHPKLESIGKQIADKLGGLPLAAKVVGGDLKHRLEERHWRNVLENKVWQEKGEILAPLRLSYNHLPAHLKKCFLYCALFPKNYYFNIDKLVHMWVAQGYIQSSNGNGTLEDIGQEYINELYSRSIFQQSLWRPSFIHDLLHDLAEFISVDEIYRMQNDSSIELKISKRVRHLFVGTSDLDRVLDQIEEPKKLRSLVHDPPHTNNISQTSCSDFKKLQRLRVLIFEEHYSSSHLPETIGNMIHLRYLKFPLGPTLPISLGKLSHLQVLELSGGIDFDHDDLSSEAQKRWIFVCTIRKKIDDSESICHCFNDQTMMSEIFGNLTNLRYINAPHSLISTIPSIGKLTSLQRLTRYKVREQEGHRICELRNLNQIRGHLCITNLENVANKEEAKTAQLHKKKHLEAISLYWNSDHSSNDDIRVHEEVLEGLQPHSNIKSIRISGYMGLEHPSWLNKSCLSNIDFILLAWGSLKALPPLEEFPSLRFLSLYSLASLKTIGLGAHGGGDKIFPSLQCLKLINLKELREWSSFKENACDLMPHLTSLDIIDCPNLKVIPPLGELPSLKSLSLEGLDLLEEIGIEIYGRGKIVFPSLECFVLSKMSGLTKWCTVEEQGQVLMPCLDELNIFNCQKLECLYLSSIKGTECLALKDGWKFRSIKGLERFFPNQGWKLGISKCPNLKVIPSLGELPSLRYLFLEELHSLEEIGVEIYGRGSGVVFPSLEDLVLSNMSGLTKWCKVEELGQGLMPYLQSLSIVNCHKFKSPVHLSSTHKRLQFGFSENADDAQIFHEHFPVGNLTYLKKLVLGPLKGLETFNDAQQKWLQSLTCLTSLSFNDCGDLQRLPDDLGSLCCLEKLKLYECFQMVSLGVNRLPKKLKLLEIRDCGELPKLCDWRQGGPEWDKISLIPYIYVIENSIWKRIPHPASPPALQE